MIWFQVSGEIEDKIIGSCEWLCAGGVKVTPGDVAREAITLGLAKARDSIRARSAAAKAPRRRQGFVRGVLWSAPKDGPFGSSPAVVELGHGSNPAGCQSCGRPAGGNTYCPTCRLRGARWGWCCCRAALYGDGTCQPRTAHSKAWHRKRRELDERLEAERAERRAAVARASKQATVEALAEAARGVGAS